MRLCDKKTRLDSARLIATRGIDATDGSSCRALKAKQKKGVRRAEPPEMTEATRLVPTQGFACGWFCSIRIYIVLRVMAPSSLPRILSPALLSYLRGHPQLPSQSWYFIAGVTLSILNRPDEISLVFQHALEKGSGIEETKPEHAEQLSIARRMREGLVKSAAIGGLPKVRNSRSIGSGMLKGQARLIVLFNQVNQCPVCFEGGNADPTAG